MKTFLILVSLELFKVVMSSPVHRTGIYHSVKKTRHRHRGYHKQRMLFGHKSNPRLGLRPHWTKPAILADTPNEQDSMLERTSPEYRYNDAVSNNVGRTEGGLSSVSNGNPTQGFPFGDSLASVESTGTRIGGIGAKPLVIGPRGPSLEELNVMLENTLPEYRYDKRKTGSGFDKCADLDPDCHQHELQGLCSDNPNFVVKRFNCKKTCNLCYRIGGIARHIKTRKRHN